jgi:hypothetical protein
MGHAYLRVGDGPCRVLTVCSDGPSLAAAGYPPTMDEPQLVQAPASVDSVAPATAKPSPKAKTRKR